MLRSLYRPLPREFTFAGFAFPKYTWTLPRGTMRKRIMRARSPMCGDYCSAPRPIAGGTHPGASFYLNSDFAPGLRWQWADQVSGARIGHRGWYADDDQDATIRGIVLRLPKGRGFLAGWSMGEGMASATEGMIFEDECDAALYAEECARVAAESEREYQAEQLEEVDA